MGALKLDSETQSLEEQLAIARTLPAEDLLEAVYNYNWDGEATEVLGVIADRPDCTLFTALQIFHGAEPGHYEGPKEPWDVPMFDLLTRIHDRINASGYRHDPADHHKPRTFNKEWFLGTQDGNESREVCHWQLDPRIVLPACETPPEIVAERAEQWRAHVENEAQKIVAGLRSNERAKRSTELLLPLMPDEIKARVAELMAAPPTKPPISASSFLTRLFKRRD